MTVFVIAAFTLREATRRKALLAALVVTVAFLGLYALGVWFIFRESRYLTHPSDYSAGLRQATISGLLLAGLYVINSMAGLLAIFTSVGAISAEIDQGTLHAVIPRPLHRWQVVAGKWLGYAAMLIPYVAITSLAAMGIMWLISSVFPSGAALGVALMSLGALLLLSLALAGSTFLPTIANGIVIFLLYSLGTFGGMIEQMGWLMSNRTLVNIGIITSLVIPTDSIWKMAAQAMQPSLPLSTLMSGAGPFATLNPPSSWMAVYSVIYGVAALAAAAIIFQRRDL